MDWSALFSTFGLIFVAELGDKTQLAVVTQTCKYRQPWAVFLGASLALTASTAIGAVGGQFLGRLVPEHVLRIVAGLAFVVMGLFIAREARKMPAHRPEDAACDPLADGKPARAWNWKAFSTTLVLLFVAELGDKTQLTVLGLAGKSQVPWTVFLGGALALILVSGLGVVGGQGLSRLIPARLLLWLSAGMFVVMGVLIGLGAL